MNEDNESRFLQATVIRNAMDRNMKSNTENESNTPGRKLRAFAAPEARPLPVIILADVSGSMAENGKIDALNVAVQQMVESFKKESRLRAEIQVGLITFGGRAATMHLPLLAAHNVTGIANFTADGATPMGSAFTLAKGLLEDKAQIPARAYRPVLILVSDGIPTDEWEEPLKALKSSERAQKASRIAMAIGADADRQLLADFANEAEAPVFQAHEANDIRKFFRAVTMSVVARSTSPTPNQPLAIEVDEIPDDLDLDAI